MSIGSRARKWPQIKERYQDLTRQFPTHRNREFIRPNRELNGGIRELFGRIREEALARVFSRGVPRYEGRGAIADLGSYPSTPLAETPRPSRRRWLTRDCSSPHASRRVEET